MDEIESLNVRSEPMGQEWAKSRNSEENAQTIQSESFRLVPLIWNSPGMVCKYQTTLESRVRPLSIGYMFPFAQDNQLIPIVLESHCCYFFPSQKCLFGQQIIWTSSLSAPVFKAYWWNFPGSPGVKAPPSNAGGTSSIPSWGAKIPHACGQKTETCNRRNIVTFKKDLKIVWRFYN